MAGTVKSVTAYFIFIIIGQWFVSAIVGNILGAHLGVENIPEKWRNSTELSGELEQLATDLFVNPKDIVDAGKRYPIH